MFRMKHMINISINRMALRRMHDRKLPNVVFSDRSNMESSPSALPFVIEEVPDSEKYPSQKYTEKEPPCIPSREMRSWRYYKSIREWYYKDN